MAKLIGPLMSIDARGSVGDALTYAKIGKTNYAKQYTVPRNPKSAAQTAHRLGIGFISSLWKTLTVEQKATWNALADQLQLPPYHAFLKTNCKRWVTDEALTCQLPIVDPYPPHNPAYPVDATPSLLPYGGPYTYFNLTLDNIQNSIYGVPHALQFAHAPNPTTDPGHLDTVAILLPAWVQDGNTSWSLTADLPPGALDATYPRYRFSNHFGGSSPWFALA